MTLKEAKDQVAKQRGYNNFRESFGISIGELLNLADKAAELYAQSKWDEAIEARDSQLILSGQALERIVDLPKPEFTK